MSAGAVLLCNRALTLIGAQTIETFDIEDEKAAACGIIYDQTKAHCIGIYPWKFTQGKKQLSRLTAAPLNEYTYAFRLPSDRIGAAVLAVYDSAEEDAVPITDYRVQGRDILANAEALYIDYTADIDESLFPTHFSVLLVYALAANLAIPIRESTSVADYWNRVAFGLPSEGGRGGFFATAAKADFQVQTGQPLENNDLIAVR